MMEIVILVEDVLQMTINNEELRHLRTVGDVKTFIECKVRGQPLPKPTKFLPIEQIMSIMRSSRRSCFSARPRSTPRRERQIQISGQEFFLQGHFKDNPCSRLHHARGAGPAGRALLLEGQVGEAGKVVDHRTIFFTSCEGVRCHRVCKPGDVLSLSSSRSA